MDGILEKAAVRRAMVAMKTNAMEGNIKLLQDSARTAADAAAALGIEEIHDYAFDANVKDKVLGWGRGFRCSRGEGAKGVKVYTAQDNAGSQGGKWLHLELSPEMAADGDRFEQVWRSLPKPG